MKLTLILLIAFVLSMSDCAKPQQDLTPADEKLVPVYADLLILNEGFKSPASTLDSTGYQQQVAAILAGNGLTREEFTNRLNSLAQSSELFQQFQTKVHNDLEHRKPK